MKKLQLRMSILGKEYKGGIYTNLVNRETAVVNNEFAETNSKVVMPTKRLPSGQNYCNALSS